MPPDKYGPSPREVAHSGGVYKTDVATACETAKRLDRQRLNAVDGSRRTTRIQRPRSPWWLTYAPPPRRRREKSEDYCVPVEDGCDETTPREYTLLLALFPSGPNKKSNPYKTRICCGKKTNNDKHTPPLSVTACTYKSSPRVVIYIL